MFVTTVLISELPQDQQRNMSSNIPKSCGNSHPQLLVNEVHELCVSSCQEDDVSHIVSWQFVLVDVVHFAHIMSAQEGIVCNLAEWSGKLLIPHNGLQWKWWICAVKFCYWEERTSDMLFIQERNWWTSVQTKFLVTQPCFDFVSSHG